MQAIFLLKNIANSSIPLLLLAVVAAALVQVGTLASGGPVLLALTLAAVGSGCLALMLLRPQRAGLSPPNVMLSLGIGGMVLGLATDLWMTPLHVIESLCAGSGGRSFGDAMVFHARLLPAMHVLMVAGGLSAIPTLRVLRPECRRLCSMLTQNALCSTWMLVGMTAGATLFAQSLTAVNGISLSRMLAGMFAGMVWGMVISVSAYRLFFIARDRFGSVPQGLSRQP